MRVCRGPYYDIISCFTFGLLFFCVLVGPQDFSVLLNYCVYVQFARASLRFGLVYLEEDTSSWVHPSPQEFNLSLLTTKYHFRLFHLSVFLSQELLKLPENGARTVANYLGWNIFDISPKMRVSHFSWRPHRERLISGHERQHCWQSDRTAGHASRQQSRTRQSSKQRLKVRTGQGVETKTTVAVTTPNIFLFQHQAV